MDSNLTEEDLLETENAGLIRLAQSSALPTTNHRSPRGTPWGDGTGVFNFEQTDAYPVPSLRLNLGGHLEGHFGIPKETYDRRVVMACPSCQSDNQAEFNAEMIIHFSGLKNLDNPGVWEFSKLLVCLDCGVSRFTISEPGRGLLIAATGTAESFAQGKIVRGIVFSPQIVL